jgi:hypothetical protein
MGPAGFCFATQDLWESFSDLDGILWQAWYMDDGTLVGTLEGLSKVVAAIQSDGPTRGLFLNKKKCVLWGPAVSPANLENHVDLQGISTMPFVPTSGLRVLGVPVDHPANLGTFTTTMFNKAVTRLEAMCSRLTHLPATHVQYTLLRYCLDGCRLNFLTRCSSMTHTTALVQRADAVLRQTLGDILGTPMSQKQWDQATLPQRLGGPGIASPKDLLAPGRLATLVDFSIRGRKVLHLQEDLNLIQPDFPSVVQMMALTLGPEFDPLKAWATDPSASLKAEAVHGQQRWWGDRWHKAYAKLLPTGLSARDQARVALQLGQRGGSMAFNQPLGRARHRTQQ